MVDLVNNDLFWYYSTWFFLIIINGTALYISKRKNHKLYYWLIIINIIISFIVEEYPANIIPYFYLSYILIIFIHSKFKGQIYKSSTRNKLHEEDRIITKNQ